jgi:hypothetical protein
MAFSRTKTSNHGDTEFYVFSQCLCVSVVQKVCTRWLTRIVFATFTRCAPFVLGERLITKNLSSFLEKTIRAARCKQNEKSFTAYWEYTVSMP